MNDVITAMIGTTLLFGHGSICTSSWNNRKYAQQVEKEKRWASNIQNQRREQQIYELLKTEAGQTHIRNELREIVLSYLNGVEFEFEKPLSDFEIRNEVKWAITWMLAKDGFAPSWQKHGGFHITTYWEQKLWKGQCALLRKNGIDVSLIEFIIENAYCISGDNSFFERKKLAKKNRDARAIAKLNRISNETIAHQKGEWMFDKVDDDTELRMLIYISEQDITSEIITKYNSVWDKLRMARYHPRTWRKDSKAFYQKWIALFEMAEMGKIPSWQVDWTPEYQSDYCCFIEQIRILDQFGHNPWPLLHQLPAEPPTKYRTLEDVLFEK